MANAGEVFGVDFMARVNVDGTEYVVYRDAYSYAVRAEYWDDVKAEGADGWNDEEEADAYDRWCSEATCEKRADVLARIAVMANMECLFDGAGHVGAEAA